MPRAGRLWLLASLFWTFITLLFCLQTWLLIRAFPNENMSFLRSITWTSTFYLVWIPGTVLVWWLAERWDPSRSGWRGVVWRHLALLLSLWPINAAVTILIATSINGWGNENFRQMFFGQIRGRIYLHIMVYIGIAASGYAMSWYARMRDREAQAARLQSQLSAARLDSLRAQLHPHFLFNSLHAIAALVREQRNDEAVRLVSGLGDLLRRVLDTADQRPRLADEIELVRRYVEIQRVRFGDRLEVAIDVDPALDDLRVPALLVQPLVENAVRHGIETREEGGRIDVRARASADDVVIEVEDNGRGLPANWSLDGTSGTGLRNLCARLSAIYDDRAHLSIGRSASGGATVSIRLPRSGV